MSRAILHFDLDTFFVSCERLANPKLIGKPVVIGGTTDRGVVSSCSYEARACGIYPMMPMKLAGEICPEAIIIKGNSGFYGKFSDLVTEIIKEESPLYEKASFDEFYVDMTGMDQFFGCYQWATALRKKIIKHSGLPISFGLSINKTVAKVGTGEAKPNGQIHVINGTERDFLGPLTLDKIPMVGPKTYEVMRGMGIHHVKTVQEMPSKYMQALLGANGYTLWKKCRGEDSTPVVPYQERKSIGIERTFERDTIDTIKLNSILIAMTENLAYQLRNGNKLTSCVTVKIRYSDLETVTKQCRVPYTACDYTLINTSKLLYKKLYIRRLSIRLISVRFSHLVQGGHQINFLEDTEVKINLFQAMDKIRNRFGQDAIKLAVAMGSRGIGRINPFNGQPPTIPAHRRA